MECFYTYMLQCNDGTYYVGHTDNIEKRIAEHQDGVGSFYTKKRLPIKLVFLEAFATRTEAFNAEHKLKTWRRTKKEAVIAGGWEALKSWKTQCKKE